MGIFCYTEFHQPSPQTLDTSAGSLAFYQAILNREDRLKYQLNGLKTLSGNNLNGPQGAWMVKVIAMLQTVPETTTRQVV